MYTSAFLNRKKQKPSSAELALQRGIQTVTGHPLFQSLPNTLRPLSVSQYGKDTVAVTASDGTIYLNPSIYQTAAQWAYMIAHCALHHVFGHFDLAKVPGHQSEQKEGSPVKIPVFRKEIWNLACDIYITKFLADMKFGESPDYCPISWLPGTVTTEGQIYEYLEETQKGETKQTYGTATIYRMDMIGLEQPVIYQRWPYHNPYTEAFAKALEQSVTASIQIAGGYEPEPAYYRTGTCDAYQAAGWFIDHYPLLGGLAAAFQIVDDRSYCVKAQIQVAAIDAAQGKIYVNSAAGLSVEEWRFVLAHEYLHCGLNHHRRCQERNFQIWNIACDFVINGWLVEMQIGSMPTIGLLYDPALQNLSAETIYDMLTENLRKARKLATFRGYEKGDMLQPEHPEGKTESDYTTFDKFCREALLQGLDYHQTQGRGMIPAGLVEEICALSVPPVPWDVRLANLFREWFPMPEKKRSYARPSRKQGATPDIPRPCYVRADEQKQQKTFGVIVDTSGSISATGIGIALGAIASYAAEREVPYVRIVFCDAAAYDAGYLPVDEIAGQVKVIGRGGTRLQPAVDLLEHADDFPKDGPILIITDGRIEPKITMHREHAWLMPKGRQLSFRTQSPVFYWQM